MKIDFVKMNGAGNDFVLIDNRSGIFRAGSDIVRHICDRRRGVGADGLILLEESSARDFRMRYFNSDGMEAEMCGNGARCIALFAAGLGLGRVAGGKRTMEFDTAAGVVGAWVEGDGVTVRMGRASRLALGIGVNDGEREWAVHFVDTGVPHAVLQCEDAGKLSDDFILRAGGSIRHAARFSPAGANVDFVSAAPDGRLHIRTYERGVKRETDACGTGAVAAAVVFSHLGLARSPVELLTRGGDRLLVAFDSTPDGADNVVLQGPAEVNFTGRIELHQGSVK